MTTPTTLEERFDEFAKQECISWTRKAGEDEARKYLNEIWAYAYRNILKFVESEIALDRAERDRELREALHALGLMWNQYCGKRGHLCMSAGESASEVLEQHCLLASEYSEADWDKLDALLQESKVT